MAKVLIFNENNGRVKQFIQSAHTPDFEGRSDALINPEVAEGVNLKAAVVENGAVRNMTQEEIDAAIEEDKRVNHARYRAQEYKHIQEQLEMMYFDKVNGTTTWQDHIAEIMKKYPPPDR